MRFDWTISLGNLASAATFLILAIIAWTDLRWRIRNLENWREEHLTDARIIALATVKQDEIIQRMDRILYHLTKGVEGVK